MTGKGLQADITGSANTTAVYVPDTTNGHEMINPYPYMSPPFLERGITQLVPELKKKKKKRKERKKRKGITARQEQPIQFNPNSRNNSIKFINKPQYALVVPSNPDQTEQSVFRPKKA